MTLGWPDASSLYNLGYEPMNDVTLVLEAMSKGDTRASEQLLPLVYDELRKLAAARMANEAAGQTLQPTALVHEAWLRLIGSDKPQQWNGRGHFFGAAAEAMRRILVERARHKARLKHGGEMVRVDLTSLDLASTSEDEAILAVSDALDRLAARDAVGAELIKLRFFVGLSQTEAAQVLDLP